MGLENLPGIHSLIISQHANYVPVSSASLVAYDHLLTLSDEVRFVWPSQWSVGKVLFFLTRYSPLVDIVLGIYRASADSPTVTTCRTLTNISGWTCFVGLLIAEFIMLMRVIAMWSRYRLVGYSLAVLAIIFIVVGATMYHTFTVKYIFVDLTHSTSPPLPGCHPDSQSKASFVSFSLLMAFEMLMLVLTVVKGVEDLGQQPSSFLCKFYKDGVFYYAMLSIVSLLNVVVLLAGPQELATILVPPKRSFHTILSSRILLRLREDASRRQDLATFTAPVGDSIFVRTSLSDAGVRGDGGAGSPSSRWWEGENATSWFGDAQSNVVGSERASELDDGNDVAEPSHRGGFA